MTAQDDTSLLDRSPDSEEFEQDTKADKLHLLFNQSFPAVFISFLNAGLLLLALWPSVNHFKLTTWFTAIAIASVIRTILFLSYRLRSPVGRRILAWETPYFVTLVFSALVWGVGCLWLIASASISDQLIVFFFLGGMAAGAVSVYSAIRSVVLATVASILVPVTVWFLISGSGAPRVLAVVCLLFMISSLRSTRILSTALHESFSLGYKLAYAKDQAEKMARTDYLTKLNNRGAFYEKAENQTAHCERHLFPLSLIVMDIDDFKAINDNHGHAIGDDVLRSVAEVIRNKTRAYDVCGRMGGEEFAILLPNTSIGQARIVADKIRLEMEENVVVTGKDTRSVTASFGVAAGLYDIEKLFALADAALYDAKKSGKNRIRYSGE